MRLGHVGRCWTKGIPGKEDRIVAGSLPDAMEIGAGTRAGLADEEDGIGQIQLGVRVVFSLPSA